MVNPFAVLLPSLRASLGASRRRRVRARKRLLLSTKENPHFYELAARRRRDLVILALGAGLFLPAGYVAVRGLPEPPRPEIESPDQTRAVDTALRRLEELKRRGGPISQAELGAALLPLEQAGLLAAGTAKRWSSLAGEGTKEIVVDAVSQLLRHFLERKPSPAIPIHVVVNASPAPVTLTCSPQLRLSNRRQETPRKGTPPRRSKPRRPSCPA